MKIHKGFDDLPGFRNAIVTSGTFDGVHKGHITLLDRIKKLSEEKSGETILMTYWPHPRIVLNQEPEKLKLLTTLDERIEILEGLGIDHLIVVPFTVDFSQTTSQKFIEEILVDTLKTQTLVIGFNHHFGKNREGSFEQLKANSGAYGFEVFEISKQEVDHIAISSTKIREALESQRVKEANNYLGRPYSFSGHVVRGMSVGKELGFPTANIENHDQGKLIPSNGAYTVRVCLGQEKWDGMMNIGVRPTFEGDRRVIEVNIFDFEKDIYGQNLKVELIDFLRKEKKFENKEALKNQLAQDKKQAINVLNSSL